MALALVYIFATAKPVSIRRLIVLFVFVLILASVSLPILHVRDAPNEALLVAASLTLLAWSMPLLQIIHDAARFRRLNLEALAQTSTVVQWTYGFAIVALPTVVATSVFDPTFHVCLATFSRSLAIASLIAVTLQFGFNLQSRRIGQTAIQRRRSRSPKQPFRSGMTSQP